MAYGKMTPYLLSMFVGTPGGSALTVPQLCDIPMWFGLFFSDPLLATDPLAVEIAGGTYDRPSASWTAFTSTGLVTATDTDFLGLPISTHATAIGLFDADINGHLLAADNFPLGSVVDLPGGGSWVMPAGEFFLGFDLTGL